MIQCRWCPWQPILLRQDGQPRRDIDTQLQSHVSGKHPQEAKAWWAASRRAQEKERALADDVLLREQENQYASRRPVHAEGFGDPNGESVEVVHRLRRR